VDKCAADERDEAERRERAAYWQGVRDWVRDFLVIAACLLVVVWLVAASFLSVYWCLDAWTIGPTLE
jgi:Flp pilus assembly protein TadB